MASPVTTMASPSIPPIWSRPTVGWMFYDLANTIFSFAILTFYFPRWVVGTMEGNDAMLGVTISTSMALLFLTAPLLGALSDLAPRRMPFLVITTTFCVAATSLLGLGGLGVSLVLFGIANYFFQGGLIFYDALLAEVSTPETRGRVSGLGVGVGYLGSLVGLGVGATLVALGAPMTYIFRAVALAFLLFALPCFLWVRERPRPASAPLSPRALFQAASAVRQTLVRARDYPGLGRFLVGRVFYTDVANTVIIFLAIYVTEELGFSEPEVNAMGAIAILAAVAGGLGWGLIVDRIGAKRTLDLILVIWTATLIVGVLIPVLGWPRELFYGIGALAGIILAGTWTADRTLMLRLSPPEYLGQFYGLYAMVGRFGQIIGPLLWGLVAVRLGLGRPAAMASLAVLLVVAQIILRPLREPQPAG